MIESSYKTSYANDKTKAKRAYSVSGTQNIKTELYKNGPLSAAFTVHVAAA